MPPGDRASQRLEGDAQQIAHALFFRPVLDRGDWRARNRRRFADDGFDALRSGQKSRRDQHFRIRSATAPGVGDRPRRHAGHDVAAKQDCRQHRGQGHQRHQRERRDRSERRGERRPGGRSRRRSRKGPVAGRSGRQRDEGFPFTASHAEGAYSRSRPQCGTRPRHQLVRQDEQREFRHRSRLAAGDRHKQQRRVSWRRLHGVIVRRAARQRRQHAWGQHRRALVRAREQGPGQEPG